MALDITFYVNVNVSLLTASKCLLLLLLPPLLLFVSSLRVHYNYRATRVLSHTLTLRLCIFSFLILLLPLSSLSLFAFSLSLQLMSFACCIIPLSLLTHSLSLSKALFTQSLNSHSPSCQSIFFDSCSLIAIGSTLEHKWNKDRTSARREKEEEMRRREEKRSNWERLSERSMSPVPCVPSSVDSTATATAKASYLLRLHPVCDFISFLFPKLCVLCVCLCVREKRERKREWAVLD